MQKKTDAAIEQYLLAFVIPSTEGAEVDRLKCARTGNMWQLAHGASFQDWASELVKRMTGLNPPAKSDDANPNASAKEPVRVCIGTAGWICSSENVGRARKVVVLDFWAATQWPVPCFSR